VAVTCSLAVALAGCGTPNNLQPVVAKRVLPSPVVSRKEEALDPKLLEAVDQDAGQPYRVGPGDTLLIAVFNHPELALGTYAGSNGAAAGLQGGRTIGFYVDNDGRIQLPLIGAVNVAGKSAEDLRVFLEEALARYVKEPKVIVQVIFNGSIRYYLLGQFVNPGLKYADRPMRLLEGLSLGGSVIFDHASLTRAYVARNGKVLPVNFRRLLRDGDLRYNIPLRGGDTIVVPDNTNEQAFVFGGAATSNSKGGVVPFVHGQLDILQALAAVGIGFRDRAQGKLSEVRVIRSEADRGEFFVVDVDKILSGDAASFSLAPGDIVFIPETAITNWNEAIQQLLPTLSTISGLLTPFVQIKFLSQ
jgi:polysaccharide export outer membrane protein